MAVNFYFPLSSKVSWSSHLLCISQFQVCPRTPGQLSGINIAQIVSPGGGELANYARSRGRAFASLWVTP